MCYKYTREICVSVYCNAKYKGVLYKASFALTSTSYFINKLIISIFWFFTAKWRPFYLYFNYKNR